MYTKAFKRLEGLARLRMHGVGHFKQTAGAGVAGARGGAFGQHRIVPGRVGGLRRESSSRREQGPGRDVCRSGLGEPRDGFRYRRDVIRTVF